MLPAVLHRFFYCLLELRFGIFENGIGDMHKVEQTRRYLPLKLVLRMVGLSVSLSAPADEQQHGNSIDVFIRERDQGVHRVAFTAVLHVNQGNFFCRQIMSGGDGHGVSLVGCDHIPAAAVYESIITEAVQIAVRNAGKEGHVMRRQCFKHFLLIQHLLLFTPDAPLAFVEREVFSAVTPADFPGAFKCVQYISGQWAGLDSVHVLHKMAEL